MYAAAAAALQNSDWPSDCAGHVRIQAPFFFSPPGSRCFLHSIFRFTQSCIIERGREIERERERKRMALLMGNRPLDCPGEETHHEDHADLRTKLLSFDGFSFYAMRLFNS